MRATILALAIVGVFAEHPAVTSRVYFDISIGGVPAGKASAEHVGRTPKFTLYIGEQDGS